MEHSALISLGPLGDRAYLARFSTEDEARRWSASARKLAAEAPGLVDVVLAYRTAAVFADPERVDLGNLELALRAIELEPPESASAGPIIEIPVLYDGDDLPDVANRLGLSPEGVIARHAGTVYDVFAVGFTPGFPYAGYLPEALEGLPRRPEPRVRVAAGSVAVAGKQTGVYPRESPGGWHLIGRTPLQIADPDADHFPIRAGDRLRFAPIGPLEFEALRGRRLECPS